MRRRPERRPRPARRTPARCPRAAAARPCRREAAPWARGWRRPAPPQRDGPRLQLARVVEQPVVLDVDRHQRLLSLGFELHDQVVYERLAGLRSGAGDGHADQVGGDRGGAALRRMRRDARHLEDRLDLALADGGRGGTEERADLLDELLHGSSSLERAALAGTWVRSPYPIGRPSPPGRAAWNAARSAGASRSTKDAPAGSTRRHSGSSTTLVRSAPSRARTDRSAPASSNALTAAPEERSATSRASSLGRSSGWSAASTSRCGAWIPCSAAAIATSGPSPGSGSQPAPARSASATAGWPRGATTTTGSATPPATSITARASSTPPTRKVALSLPMRRLEPPASTAAATSPSAAGIPGRPGPTTNTPW